MLIKHFIGIIDRTTKKGTQMNFSVTFKDDIIKVEKHEEGQPSAVWSRDIKDMEPKTVELIDFNFDKEHRFKVLFWEPVGEYILMVYTKLNNMHCGLLTPTGARLRLVRRYNELLDVSIKNGFLNIQWYGSAINYFNLPISEPRFCIGDFVSQPFDLPVFLKNIHDDKKQNKKCIHHFQFKISDLIQKDGKINSRIYISMKINDFPVEYPVRLPESEPEYEKYRYVPLCSTYYNDHAIHIRSTLNNTLALVCRKMEDVEYTRWFRFWESPAVSKMLYQRAKKEKLSTDKKVCLFYEKFAEKAEEGTYDIFKKLRSQGADNVYFVIDKNSADYERIKDEPGVVKKYSAKYYWLLYRANAFISTETPPHINLLRSNNIYLRKAMAEDDFFFLQHGVTYLKCHGVNSPFIAGKESTPSYIVVGSEKEKQVVHETFLLPEDRILKTGLPIFSKISYKHLNQDSEDIAVIMLTWKPYEEYLDDFRESSYYKNTVAIYNLLTKYLPPENVRIVAHPKISNLIDGTPLAANIWQKPISDVLSIAKLLVTDYSSVCYNSFYQGGGVIFFQEDLEFYEEQNGKLIPSDDEYIGMRAFSLEELDQMFSEGIKDQQILLDYYHTEEFEKRYLTINEFTDGKNIDRIYEELKRLHFIS